MLFVILKRIWGQHNQSSMIFKQRKLNNKKIQNK